MNISEILRLLKNEIEYREKVNAVAVKKYGSLDPVSCQAQGAVTEAKRIYIMLAQKKLTASSEKEDAHDSTL